MVTDGRMATATDAATLTLAQWFSPAYPVGAFQFSHGLERAIDCGDVSDGDALAAWIHDVVRHGSGASDVLFLSAAYLAETEARLLEVDELARAFAPSAERLRETVDMGRTFRRTTASLLGRELPELVHPVVAGLCARLADLPLRLTASMYLQAVRRQSGVGGRPPDPRSGRPKARKSSATCCRSAWRSPKAARMATSTPSDHRHSPRTSRRCSTKPSTPGSFEHDGHERPPPDSASADRSGRARPR